MPVDGYSDEGDFVSGVKRYIEAWGVKAAIKNIGVKREWIELCVPISVDAFLVKSGTESSSKPSVGGARTE